MGLPSTEAWVEVQRQWAHGASSTKLLINNTNNYILQKVILCFQKNKYMTLTFRSPARPSANQRYFMAWKLRPAECVLAMKIEFMPVSHLWLYWLMACCTERGLARTLNPINWILSGRGHTETTARFGGINYSITKLSLTWKYRCIDTYFNVEHKMGFTYITFSLKRYGFFIFNFCMRKKNIADMSKCNIWLLCFCCGWYSVPT